MSRVTDAVMKRFSADAFDARLLAAAKGGERISVCIPARDEEATIGEIVTTIHDDLVSATSLIDEIVVIDDHSEDQTAVIAAKSGAIVVSADEIALPTTAPVDGHVDAPTCAHGKGEALWRSMHASTGDIIAWCDGDLVGFTSDFIVGLVGPLLVDPSIAFVKAHYERPLHGHPEGGGRVTELVARPALTLLFPELAELAQPLAGEYSGRRDILEQVPFSCGYGVDVGLVIDIAKRFGTGSIAQVDLGTRHHRNRPVEELGPMATEVLAAILARADSATVPVGVRWSRPGSTDVAINTRALPAPMDIPAYRDRRIDTDIRCAPEADLR